ncbi:MAG TPA: SBBP repeat-containing protein, partial [Flavipsychrobacter sp.]|nr:SBBP repeat-containing protein [Flavipsychrobacter sp.]
DIDWVLYIKDAQLEYDFIVRPGGNVKDIKLKYRGATQLSKQDGAICINTPMGKVSERSLFSYDLQTSKEVASRFVLGNNVISFDVSHRGNTIVIDPKLLWGTYYGGHEDDNMYYNNPVFATGQVTCDAWGNVYLYGITNSSNNIATTGSHQDTLDGERDVFLAKFNSLGARFWSTYYGGEEIEIPGHLACDNVGNIYITGVTDSYYGIATPGSYSDTIALPSTAVPPFGVDLDYGDAFLVKFDSSGTRQWGTYYGDTSGGTSGSGVACDETGNVYLFGTTNSYSGIATPGSYKDTFSGDFNCFIAKFTPLGKRLWGTYYGDSEGAYSSSIKYDNRGHIYITGNKIDIIDYPEVGFVAKFDTSGNLNWDVNYGGYLNYPIDIACDKVGNIFVGGQYFGIDYQSTPVSFQRFPDYYENAFLSKFDSSGNIKWSTYYGYRDSMLPYGIATGIACDTNNNVIFCGYTNNEGNIATVGSIQSKKLGNVDGFVAKFTNNGERIWGTYFGGNNTFPTGIACDPANNIYLTGSTQSDTLIATDGGFQTIKDTTTLLGWSPDFRGPYRNYDAFLAKIANDTGVYIIQPFNDTTICRGTTFNLPFGTNYNFQSDNVFDVQLSDTTGSFNSPTVIGSIKATGTSGTISCTIPDSISLGGEYRIRIVASDPVFISSDNSVNIHIDSSLSPFSIFNNSPVCSGDSLKIYAPSAVTYSWTGPDSFKSTISNIVVDSVSPKYAGTYYVTATALGCPSVSDSVTIIIKPNATPVVKPVPLLCDGDSLVLNMSDTTAGVTYLWTGPGLHTNRPDTTIDSPKSGYYVWTITLGSCYVKDSINVNIGYRPPTPKIINNSPICYSDTLHLEAYDDIWSVSYNWLLPDSTTSTKDSLDIYHAKSGVYKIWATEYGCSSEDSVKIDINSNVIPSVSIKESNNRFMAGVADTFTAHVVNGGTSPTYQWYVNNKIVAGETGGIFIIGDLKQGDIVSVLIHSNANCAIPDTAASKTWPLGIATVTANNSKYILYPNPNDGSFTIDGNAGLTATNATVEVINLAGVIVDKEAVAINNGVLHKTVELSPVVPSGLYFIRIRTDEQTTILRFAIER